MLTEGDIGFYHLTVANIDTYSHFTPYLLMFWPQEIQKQVRSKGEALGIPLSDFSQQMIWRKQGIVWRVGLSSQKQ